MLIPLIAGLFAGAVPQVGQVAPEFKVTDTEGKVHVLSELVTKGPVILAFFPKAFTPGCTTEMKAYRDRHEEILKHEGTVLAVSGDDVETLKRFKAELKAPYAFIADEKGELASLYDVKMPVVAYAKRYTFVIGPDRKIVSVDSGSDAVNVKGAVQACSMARPDAGR